MAIIKYDGITPEKRKAVGGLLKKFRGEVSQCSMVDNEAQIVLNDFEITEERGQEFLNEVTKILKPTRWGYDMPPDFVERKYIFEIPFDPNII